MVFGDVVRSRADPEGSTRWLTRLCATLDRTYGDDRLAPFDFTQGDEVQGLLRPTADPFRAVMIAGLADDAKERAMRWVVVAGVVDPGRGRATQRTGPAFVAAREAIRVMRTRRDRLRAVSGDGDADALLDDVAPLLGVLLAELSDRQRTVARLLLLDGLRQAEAATALDVSRATISVIAERGHVREIDRLARALQRVFVGGVERARAESGPGPGTKPAAGDPPGRRTGVTPKPSGEV